MWSAKRPTFWGAVNFHFMERIEAHFLRSCKFSLNVNFVWRNEAHFLRSQFSFCKCECVWGGGYFTLDEAHQQSFECSTSFWNFIFVCLKSSCQVTPLMWLLNIYILTLRAYQDIIVRIDQTLFNELSRSSGKTYF